MTELGKFKRLVKEFATKAGYENSLTSSVKKIHKEFSTDEKYKKTSEYLFLQEVFSATPNKEVRAQLRNKILGVK